MHKPGSKGGGFRIGGNKWNRRFVWVENNAVHYGPAERKSERSVPLNELKSVRVCTEREIADEKGPQQYLRNGWRLSTRDKVIIFVSEQQSERDAWVGGLNVFIRKAHANDLDDDDEVTYRQLQESSRAFNETARRSTSVFSTANFNSDEMDQLMEDEEAVRVRLETIFRKESGELRRKFFDEMDDAITAEESAVTQMRSRSQSMANISRSPSIIRPDDDDNEGRTQANVNEIQRQSDRDEAKELERQRTLEEDRKLREAHEAERLRALEEEQRRNAEHLQSCVEAQEALADLETSSRLAVFNECTLAEAEVSSQERKSRATVIAIVELRRAESIAAFKRQQEDSVLDFTSQEAEMRHQIEFAEERDSAVVIDAKSIDMARAQKKERNRLGDELRALEKRFASEKMNISAEESTSRKAATQEEAREFAKTRELHDSAHKAIRVALAQQLQDAHERHVAAQVEEQQQYICNEAAKRDELSSGSIDCFGEIVSMASQHRVDALLRMEQRLRIAAEDHQLKLEGERQDLIDEESMERGDCESEARDTLEQIASQWVAAERQVTAAIAKRVAAEAEAMRLHQLNQRNAMLDEEAQRRNQYTLDESEQWSKSVANAALASKRQAEQSSREREKRTLSENKKARESLASAEGKARQTLRSEESADRSSLGSAVTKSQEQSRKREQHRKALQQAALAYEEREEENARVTHISMESSEWDATTQRLTLLWNGHYMGERIVEEEMSDRTTLSIAMDCGAEEAEEAAAKRVAATMRLIGAEEDNRSDVLNEMMTGLDALSQLHARGTQAASLRVEERLRLIKQFHAHADQSHEEIVSNEMHDWETIRAQAEESTAHAELAAARRKDDAAAVLMRTHELERKTVARSEAEGRIEAEEEGDTEWSELMDACAIGRERIESRVRARNASLQESIDKLLHSERDTRSAAVATERDERDFIEQASVNELPKALAIHSGTTTATEVAAQEATSQGAPTPQQTSPEKSSQGESYTTPPVDDDRASISSRSTSDSTRNSANRRSRAATIAMRQAAAAQAAAAAEEQLRTERAALEQFVKRGCWMFKPGSQASSGASSRWFGGSKWHKRFVWVRGNAVLYGEKPEKPEKPLQFQSLRKVSLVSALDAERENCPKELRSFVWKLSTSEKTIFFACQSERDRNNWIKYLEVLTKNQDLESTVNSVRSFAASLAYEQTGWNVEGEDDYDGEYFEEGEEEEGEEELTDPFAEDEPYQETPVAKPKEEQPAASTPQFVPNGAGLDHLGDDVVLPDTFEGWCNLLQTEESREREDLSDAQERHRSRMIRERGEFHLSTRMSTLSADTAATSDAPVVAHSPSAQHQASPSNGASSGALVEDNLVSSQSMAAASRRDRSSTIARRDEALQKRADAVAAAIAAETAERERIVTTGSWMYKPRSKSNTSSIMRSISSIGGTSWNKRYVWVDVRKSRILYGEKPGKPEKEVPMRAIQSIYPLPPDVMKREGAPKNLWTLGFKITADDRTILWAATDAKVRKAFIDFLTPVAKRQPSGLQPRPQAYGSLNNDLDEEGQFEDPFADDYYDEDYDPEYDDSEVKNDDNEGTEVSGGPTTVKKQRQPRTAAGHRGRSLAREPQVPLMSMGMFLLQVGGIAHLCKEEGLVGVGVANGEGLLIQSAGEVNAHVAGRAAKVSSIAQSLRSGHRRHDSQIGGSGPSETTSPRPRASTLSTSITSAGSSLPRNNPPISILIEIEGPQHHVRTISMASTSHAGDIVCLAIHQNPLR